MSDIIKQLALQLFLILLNAFFAATEIAVISLNEKKIKARAEDGDKKAGRMLKMIEEPTRFLSTIQIGITIAGFLGSAFAADNFAERLSDSIINTFGISPEGAGAVNTLSVIVITLILSFFTLVLGELVPKRVAMRHKEKLAELVCGVISGLAVALKPVIWLLTVSTNGVLRLIGIDPKSEDEEVTEEEIRLMVDAGEEDGNIEQNEKEMIENIFEFNNITAADVMVHRTEMTAVNIADTVDTILQTIKETGFSRFPVYEDNIDNIVGILSTRNFLLNVCSDNPKKLKELTYEPYFVPESVRADALFSDMQSKNCHMVVVLDEYGGTSGLVTMEDLLEEIVGNIYDETDDKEDEPQIEKIGDNLYRIQGGVELETIEEELGINFSEEDDELSTLSGLIFSRFTTIPADGETPELDIDRLHIKVENITEHRVVSAVVELLPEPDTGTEDENDSKDE